MSAVLIVPSKSRNTDVVDEVERQHRASVPASHPHSLSTMERANGVARRGHRRGIVPHTHWDREWYAPFQAYRVQLVHLVDDLLDLLERDAVVRAVPARRPDRGRRRLPRGAARSRGAARARSSAPGALQVGPWMILMDEFMVSGETIVRDLQHRPRRAPTSSAAADAGGLPARHVRARRADAADPAPRRARARGRVAGRAGGDRRSTAFWWERARRLTRARRVPLRLVLERARPPGRPGRSSWRVRVATSRARRRRARPAAACCS